MLLPPSQGESKKTVIIQINRKKCIGFSGCKNTVIEMQYMVSRLFIGVIVYKYANYRAII